MYLAAMCAQCVTSADAVVMNAMGAAAAASVGFDRLRWRVRGRSSLERRVASWQRDAGFCHLLGLDPVAVLGPAPGDAVVDPQPAEVAFEAPSTETTLDPPPADGAMDPAPAEAVLDPA